MKRDTADFLMACFVAGIYSWGILPPVLDSLPLDPTRGFIIVLVTVATAVYITFVRNKLR